MQAGGKMQLGDARWPGVSKNGQITRWDLSSQLVTETSALMCAEIKTFLFDSVMLMICEFW